MDNTVPQQHPHQNQHNVGVNMVDEQNPELLDQSTQQAYAPLLPKNDLATTLERTNVLHPRNIEFPRMQTQPTPGGGYNAMYFTPGGSHSRVGENQSGSDFRKRQMEKLLLGYNDLDQNYNKAIQRMSLLDNVTIQENDHNDNKNDQNNQPLTTHPTMMPNQTDHTTSMNSALDDGPTTLGTQTLHEQSQQQPQQQEQALSTYQFTGIKMPFLLDSDRRVMLLPYTSDPDLPMPEAKLNNDQNHHTKHKLENEYNGPGVNSDKVTQHQNATTPPNQNTQVLSPQFNQNIPQYNNSSQQLSNSYQQYAPFAPLDHYKPLLFPDRPIQSGWNSYLETAVETDIRPISTINTTTTDNTHHDLSNHSTNSTLNRDQNGAENTINDINEQGQTNDIIDVNTNSLTTTSHLPSDKLINHQPDDNDKFNHDDNDDSHEIVFKRPVPMLNDEVDTWTLWRNYTAEAQHAAMVKLAQLHPSNESNGQHVINSDLTKNTNITDNINNNTDTSTFPGDTSNTTDKSTNTNDIDSNSTTIQSINSSTLELPSSMLLSSLPKAQIDTILTAHAPIWTGLNPRDAALEAGFLGHNYYNQVNLKVRPVVAGDTRDNSTLHSPNINHNTNMMVTSDGSDRKISNDGAETKNENINDDKNKEDNDDIKLKEHQDKPSTHKTQFEYYYDTHRDDTMFSLIKGNIPEAKAVATIDIDDDGFTMERFPTDEEKKVIEAREQAMLKEETKRLQEQQENKKQSLKNQTVDDSKESIAQTDLQDTSQLESNQEQKDDPNSVNTLDSAMLPPISNDFSSISSLAQQLPQYPNAPDLREVELERLQRDYNILRGKKPKIKTKVLNLNRYDTTNNSTRQAQTSPLHQLPSQLLQSVKNCNPVLLLNRLYGKEDDDDDDDDDQHNDDNTTLIHTHLDEIDEVSTYQSEIGKIRSDYQVDDEGDTNNDKIKNKNTKMNQKLKRFKDPFAEEKALEASGAIHFPRYPYEMNKDKPFGQSDVPFNLMFTMNGVENYTKPLEFNVESSAISQFDRFLTFNPNLDPRNQQNSKVQPYKYDGKNDLEINNVANSSPSTAALSLTNPSTANKTSADDLNDKEVDSTPETLDLVRTYTPPTTTKTLAPLLDTTPLPQHQHNDVVISSQDKIDSSSETGMINKSDNVTTTSIAVKSNDNDNSSVIPAHSELTAPETETVSDEVNWRQLPPEFNTILNENHFTFKSTSRMVDNLISTIGDNYIYLTTALPVEPFTEIDSYDCGRKIPLRVLYNQYNLLAIKQQYSVGMSELLEGKFTARINILNYNSPRLIFEAKNKINQAVLPNNSNKITTSSTLSSKLIQNVNLESNIFQDSYNKDVLDTLRDQICLFKKYKLFFFPYQSLQHSSNFTTFASSHTTKQNTNLTYNNNNTDSNGWGLQYFNPHGGQEAIFPPFTKLPNFGRFDPLKYGQLLRVFQSPELFSYANLLSNVPATQLTSNVDMNKKLLLPKLYQEYIKKSYLQSFLSNFRQQMIETNDLYFLSQSPIISQSYQQYNIDPINAKAKFTTDLYYSTALDVPIGAMQTATQSFAMELLDILRTVPVNFRIVCYNLITTLTAQQPQGINEEKIGPNGKKVILPPSNTLKISTIPTPVQYLFNQATQLYGMQKMKIDDEKRVKMEKDAWRLKQQGLTFYINDDKTVTSIPKTPKSVAVSPHSSKNVINNEISNVTHTDVNATSPNMSRMTTNMSKFRSIGDHDITDDNNNADLHGFYTTARSNASRFRRVHCDGVVTDPNDHDFALVTQYNGTNGDDYNDDLATTDAFTVSTCTCGRLLAFAQWYAMYSNNTKTKKPMISRDDTNNNLNNNTNLEGSSYNQSQTPTQQQNEVVIPHVDKIIEMQNETDVDILMLLSTTPSALMLVMTYLQCPCVVSSFYLQFPTRFRPSEMTNTTYINPNDIAADVVYEKFAQKLRNELKEMNEEEKKRHLQNQNKHNEIDDINDSSTKDGTTTNDDEDDKLAFNQQLTRALLSEVGDFMKPPLLFSYPNQPTKPLQFINGIYMFPIHHDEYSKLDQMLKRVEKNMELPVDKRIKGFDKFTIEKIQQLKEKLNQIPHMMLNNTYFYSSPQPISISTALANTTQNHMRMHLDKIGYGGNGKRNKKGSKKSQKSQKSNKSLKNNNTDSNNDESDKDDEDGYDPTHQEITPPVVPKINILPLTQISKIPLFSIPIVPHGNAKVDLDTLSSIHFVTTNKNTINTTATEALLVENIDPALNYQQNPIFNHAIDTIMLSYKLKWGPKLAQMEVIKRGRENIKRDEFNTIMVDCIDGVFGDKIDKSDQNNKNDQNFQNENNPHNHPLVTYSHAQSSIFLPTIDIYQPYDPASIVMSFNHPSQSSSLTQSTQQQVQQPSSPSSLTQLSNANTYPQINTCYVTHQGGFTVLWTPNNRNPLALTSLPSSIDDPYGQILPRLPPLKSPNDRAEWDKKREKLISVYKKSIESYFLSTHQKNTYLYQLCHFYNILPPSIPLGLVRNMNIQGNAPMNDDLGELCTIDRGHFLPQNPAVDTEYDISLTLGTTTLPTVLMGLERILPLLVPFWDSTTLLHQVNQHQFAHTLKQQPPLVLDYELSRIPGDTDENTTEAQVGVEVNKSFGITNSNNGSTQTSNQKNEQSLSQSTQSDHPQRLSSEELDDLAFSLFENDPYDTENTLLDGLLMLNGFHYSQNSSFYHIWTKQPIVHYKPGQWEQFTERMDNYPNDVKTFHQNKQLLYNNGVIDLNGDVDPEYIAAFIAEVGLEKDIEDDLGDEKESSPEKMMEKMNKKMQDPKLQSHLSNLGVYHQPPEIPQKPTPIAHIETPLPFTIDELALLRSAHKHHSGFTKLNNELTNLYQILDKKSQQISANYSNFIPILSNNPDEYQPQISDPNINLGGLNNFLKLNNDCFDYTQISTLQNAIPNLLSLLTNILSSPLTTTSYALLPIQQRQEMIKQFSTQSLAEKPPHTTLQQSNAAYQQLLQQDTQLAEKAKQIHSVTNDKRTLSYENKMKGVNNLDDIDTIIDTVEDDANINSCSTENNDVPINGNGTVIKNESFSINTVDFIDEINQLYTPNQLELLQSTNQIPEITTRFEYTLIKPTQYGHDFVLPTKFHSKFEQISKLFDQSLPPIHFRRNTIDPKQSNLTISNQNPLTTAIPSPIAQLYILFGHNIGQYLWVMFDGLIDPHFTQMMMGQNMTIPYDQKKWLDFDKPSLINVQGLCNDIKRNVTQSIILQSFPLLSKKLITPVNSPLYVNNDQNNNFVDEKKQKNKGKINKYVDVFAEIETLPSDNIYSGIIQQLETITSAHENNLIISMKEIVKKQEHILSHYHKEYLSHVKNSSSKLHTGPEIDPIDGLGPEFDGLSREQQRMLAQVKMEELTKIHNPLQYFTVVNPNIARFIYNNPYQSYLHKRYNDKYEVILKENEHFDMSDDDDDDSHNKISRNRANKTEHQCTDNDGNNNNDDDDQKDPINYLDTLQDIYDNNPTGLLHFDDKNTESKANDIDSSDESDESDEDNDNHHNQHPSKFKAAMTKSVKKYQSKSKSGNENENSILNRIDTKINSLLHDPTSILNETKNKTPTQIIVPQQLVYPTLSPSIPALEESYLATHLYNKYLPSFYTIIENLQFEQKYDIEFNEQYISNRPFISTKYTQPNPKFLSNMSRMDYITLAHQYRDNNYNTFLSNSTQKTTVVEPTVAQQHSPILSLSLKYIDVRLSILSPSYTALYTLVKNAISLLTQCITTVKRIRSNGKGLPQMGYSLLLNWFNTQCFANIVTITIQLHYAVLSLWLSHTMLIGFDSIMEQVNVPGVPPNGAVATRTLLDPLVHDDEQKNNKTCENNKKNEQLSVDNEDTHGNDTVHDNDKTQQYIKQQTEALSYFTTLSSLKSVENNFFHPKHNPYFESTKLLVDMGLIASAGIRPSMLPPEKKL